MRIIVGSILVLLSSHAIAVEEAKPAPKVEAPAKPNPARIAEDMIRSDMKEKHVTMATLKCPDEADYAGAQPITCSGTDDDGTKSDFTLKITKTIEKDEQNAKATKTHAELSWTAQRSIIDLETIGAKMSASLTKAMKKSVTVDCPHKAVLKKDDCSVVCNGKVDGKAHKISIAGCPDAAGHMQLKVD
jgi:hypothetical protein